MAAPALIVVTGPAGSGKTSLARELAQAIGCPAISRDEIKEGMAFAERAFVPRVGDELTHRTLPVFFRTIRLLLESGTTTVAEAAFQHHVWAPNLGPLRDLAVVNVVRCRTESAVARERVRHRAGERSSHVDTAVLDDPDYYELYRWLDIDERSIDVDTTNGYDPTILGVVGWVAAGLR